MNTYQFTPAVEAAINNDEQAFAFLYEKSYPLLKKEAFKYVKNEFDADDILQNTYISIFKNIGTLKDPERFLPWAVTICRNFCVNECVQANRISERTEFRPAASEEDKEGLDTIAASEYDLSVNPEAAYDAYETKRLLGEMIDELPTMQRTCIMLWQEEFSTKEIAEKVGLPEGTVKSNVNYAKKKIKEKILLLEKQGTKLYGLAPVSFFLWIMRLYWNNYSPASIPDGTAGSLTAVSKALSGSAAKTLAAASKGSVLKGSKAARGAVLKGSALKGTAAGGAKAAAGTAISKVFVGVIAGSVVIGGTVGGVAAVNMNRTPESTDANKTAYDIVIDVPAGSSGELQEEINKEAERIAKETAVPEKAPAQAPSKTSEGAPAETPAVTPEAAGTADEAAEVIQAAQYSFSMPDAWERKVTAEVSGDEIAFKWNDTYTFARFYTQADTVATGGTPDVIGRVITQLPDGQYLVLSANNDSGLIKTGDGYAAQLSEDGRKELIAVESGGSVSYEECLAADVYQGVLSEELRNRIDDFYANTVIPAVSVKNGSESSSANRDTFDTDDLKEIMPEAAGTDENTDVAEANTYSGTVYETSRLTFNTPELWDGNLNIEVDESQHLLAFYTKSTEQLPMAYIVWGTSQEVQQLNIMANAMGFGLYDGIWSGTASNGDVVMLSVIRIPAENLVMNVLNSSFGTTHELTEDERQQWQDMLDYSSGMSITVDECLEIEKTVESYTDPKRIPEFAELYRRQDEFFRSVVIPGITLK